MLSIWLTFSNHWRKYHLFVRTRYVMTVIYGSALLCKQTESMSWHSTYIHLYDNLLKEDRCATENFRQVQRVLLFDKSETLPSWITIT